MFLLSESELRDLLGGMNKTDLVKLVNTQNTNPLDTNTTDTDEDDDDQGTLIPHPVNG